MSLAAAQDTSPDEDEPGLSDVISGGLAAPSEDPGALFAAGAERLRRQEWAAAETAFTRVLGSWPAHPDVLALLGLAQYHQGRHVVATESLAVALEGGTRYEARVLYYLGLVLEALGEHDDARQAFERLLLNHPQSPEAGKVTVPSVSALPAERVRLPALQLILLQSINYDDNPSLSSDLLTTLAADPDWSHLTFVAASWQVPRIPVRLQGMFFWQNFFELDYLDMVGASLGVEGEFKLRADGILQPTYTFQRLWLDNEDFEAKHSFGLRWKQPVGATLSSDLAVEFGLKSHEDPQFEVLDGEALTVRLGSRWKPKGGGLLQRVGLRVTYAEDSAEDKYLGYRSLQIRLEARTAPLRGIFLEIRAGYRGREYDGVHPTFAILRGDDRWSLDLSAQRPLGTKFFAKLSVSLTDNESNVSDYTYEQFRFAAELVAIF